MYKHFKYSLIASSLCLVLVSCNKAGGPGYSKVNSFSTQGCVAGGVLGAIIGATVGDRSDAAGGAVLGCAIGAYAGFRVAKRTEHYINAQQAVEAEITRNKKNTEGVRKNNQQLTRQITQYKSSISSVNRSRVSAKTKKNDLKRIKNHLQKTIKQSSSDLNALNQELVTAKKLHKKHNVKTKPQKTKNWSREIASLEKEKQILSRHVKSLTALEDSI